MSRIRNLVSGVSSSYLALASNIVYTMGSIPVALHYLSKEEFGLWALISQLAGYLALIDLGMGSSAARILIDYKDDRDGGRYGSAVVTSGLVFITQGTLIGGFGCLLSPFVALLAQVSPQFSHLFGNLFAFQSILLGLGFVVRAVSTPAVAHQRYYVGNLALMVQLLVSFAVLWIGFSMHLKLYSMVLAGLLGFLCSATIHTIAVIKMGFLPSRGCWGKPDRRIFRELFLYGKDVFLLSLGWQLLNASQVVVITRVMGLDAAATWSVCTKIFTLAQQLVWRIYDMSVGAFTEMLVRGENDRLSKRFRETLVLTASLSIFVAATVALCNASFLSLWTHGRISWSPLNDMLLGVLMVVYSVNRCHGGLFGVTKQIGAARYIYFAEGAAFVVLAFFASKKWGFPGMIVCAIVLDILLSGFYSLWRSKCFFGYSCREMTLGWLKAPALYAVVFLPLAFGVSELIGSSGAYAFFLQGGLLALLGMPLLWFLGIPCELRMEIKTKLTRCK